MAIAAAIRVFAGRMLAPLTPVGIRPAGWICRVDWLDDCRRSDRPADCQSEIDHGQPVHQRKLSVSWNSTIPVPAVWCADEKLPLMDTGYPGGLPAREPAPSYAGEGPATPESGGRTMTPNNLCVEFGPQIGAELDTIISPPVYEPISG